ncbi:MAG: FliM/FliN family flagellar motor switch protein [Vicinamibacterales bacterium]
MSSSQISSSSSSPVEVTQSFEGLLDVLVPLEIVLGTGYLTVRECLALRRNSVVRVSQSAGSDLQVCAAGIILARGEVVIVEDSTAIRITEIEGPAGQDGM